MTLLAIPFVLWGEAPTAAFTRATSSEDGRTLVLSLSNGALWLVRFQGLDVHGSLEACPVAYLVGHSAPVTAMLMCRLELDGPALNETVVVSGSETAEIIMWDLKDGRCLQTKTLDWLTSISDIKSTSNGKQLLCSGYSNYLALLDACNLDTLAILDIAGDWVSCLCLYKIENSNDDRLYFTLADGSLGEANLDTSKLTVKNAQSVGHAPDTIAMQVSPFDKRLIMALSPTAAMIYFSDGNGLRQVARLVATSPWTGGKFMSLRTVLLWSTTGESSMYYLGPSKDLCFIPLSSAPADVIALVSDGDSLCYSQELKIGPSQSYRDCALIATFESPDESHGWLPCHMPVDASLTRRAQTIIYLDTRNNSEGLLRASVFWSGLLGAEIPTISPPVSSGPGSPIRVLTLAQRIDLYSGLPFQKDSHVTSVTILMKKILAAGMDDGSIHLVPLSEVMTTGVKDLANLADVSLATHPSAVSCLYGTDVRQSEKDHLLFCGSSDGWVYMFDLNSGTLLDAFCHHSGKVIGFASFGTSLNLKTRTWIASLSLDNTVAIYDVEDKCCLYRFFGHSSAIRSIILRSSEDVLIVKCADGLGYIWQLSTGHLDRTTYISESPELCDDADITIDCSGIYHGFIRTNGKKTVEVIPTSSPREEKSPFFILQVNTRRLIDEVYNGIQVLTPVTPMATKAIAKPRHAPGTNFVNSLTTRFSKKKKQTGPDEFTDDRRRRVLTARGDKPDPELVHRFFAALLVWNLDAAADQLCIEKLGMKVPGEQVSIGLRGAAGNISVLAMRPDSSRSIWCLSPYMTAFRLLNIIAVVNSVLSIRGTEQYTNTFITHYGVILPDIIGRGFNFPSLSFLAKFWQDPIIDVQQASRSLLSSTLSKMPMDEKLKIVNYWKSHLPTSYQPIRCGKANMKATIILGVIGLHQEHILSEVLCKEVAASLELLLREDFSSPYPSAAIEILGRAFPLWQAHLNGAAIIRHLVSLTGLIVNNSPQTPTSPFVSTQKSLTPAIMIGARQAITCIASFNSALVISTLSFDLLHAKTDGERSGCIKLIGMFFGKKNTPMYPYLSQIVEAMVKVLDPNTPEVRDSLLPIVTVNFAELVRSYPNVHFHAQSQRLAVGTMEGLVFIYDLRTATKVSVLEGHTKPVSAVSISDDGKLVSSFSVDENCLKFWQPYAGFLGSLVGAFSTTAAGQATGAVLANLGGGGRIKPYRSFNVGPPQANVSLETYLEQVSLQWVSDRGIRLKSVNGVDLVFNV